MHTLNPLNAIRIHITWCHDVKLIFYSYYPLNTRCTFHLLELGPGDLPFSLGDDFTCLHLRRNWENFFKAQWFWAQVGMLVLNAMNGLTRMQGTLVLRRDTGAPSMNKSLIVLANAFRCVHPAVRPGADLHFKPICFGKAAAATDGLTVQHIFQIMLYHPLQSRNMASPSSLCCLEWHAKNFEYRMCPFILNDFVCDRCGGTAPKRQSSGCGNCGHGWVSKLLDFPAKLVSLQSYV